MRVVDDLIRIQRGSGRRPSEYGVKLRTLPANIVVELTQQGCGRGKNHGDNSLIMRLRTTGTAP